MNYYEQIFKELSLNSDKDQALNEVVKIFLFRNTKFSMPEHLNKTDVFFQSNFIQLLQDVHLKQDDWQLALSQYFRFGKIDNDLFRFFLDLDEENTIFAIRLSGIIDNLEHAAWEIIRTQQENYFKLKGFIEVVEFLNKQYQEIKASYLAIKKKWQWEHLDIIVFSSLYLYEVVLTQYKNDKINIPYQIDINTPISQEVVFDALHHLIIYAYKSRRALTDKNLRSTLDNKVAPFIYERSFNQYKLEEYRHFQKIVAYRVEMNLFNDFVFNAFKYEKEMNCCIDNGILNCKNSKSGCDFDTEKFSILHLYWRWRGWKHLEKDGVFDKYSFNHWLKSYDPVWVMDAYSDTYSAILLLEEIYGVKRIILNDDCEYDVFNTLFALNIQKVSYKKLFIQPFLKVYEFGKFGNIHPFKILGIMTMGNYLVGSNFYPIVTGKKENKAKSMSQNWILEGSNKIKMKQMTEILDFWTVNLNENNLDGYFEKPFYELDGRIIQIPQRVGQQNIYGGIVNYLRKLHKNRKTLKDETGTMEKSLAELFEQQQFKVFCQYMPDDHAVGEIDLIVVEDKTVLVIELKSTFLKTNLKEVYQYQNFTLRKAAFQLDRKLQYVRDNYQHFIDKPLEEIQFYSWIVDTTLEADHQYFNAHLKISLEELVIYLKGHQDFMDCYDNLDGRYKDNSSQVRLGLDELIAKVEKNVFWDNCLNKYQNIDEKFTAGMAMSD